MEMDHLNILESYNIVHHFYKDFVIVLYIGIIVIK